MERLDIAGVVTVARVVGPPGLVEVVRVGAFQPGQVPKAARRTRGGRWRSLSFQNVR